MPSGLAPLRHRNFALYLMGQSVSNIGNALEATATSWLLYELTDSPALLGLGGLFRAAPLFIFTLVGGALADRVPKRPLLFTSQTTLVCISSAMAALVFTGLVQPWHIYIYNFFVSGIAAFDFPARQSLYAGLVPREETAAAVNLNSVAWRSMSIVGPAVAGVVISTAGIGPTYVVNGASFVGLIVALAAMRLPTELPAAGKQPLGRDIKDGLAFVSHSRVLVTVLLVEAAAAMFGYWNALLTVYARDVLQAGVAGFGLLRSATAAGAVLGSATLVAANRVGKKHTIMVASAAIYAVAYLAFAFSRSLELSMLILLVTGAADAVGAVTRTSVVFLLTPEAMRGRALGLVALASRMKNMADMQSGAAIELLGPTAAVLIGAGFVGLTAAVQARFGRGADEAIAALRHTPHARRDAAARD